MFKFFSVGGSLNYNFGKFSYEKYNQYDNINYGIYSNSSSEITGFNYIISSSLTIPLNNEIIELGKNLSFPVIVKNSNQLKFKRSNLKSTFKLGKFNIPEPVNDKNDVIPQLFFVPCLGFDLQGFRLGYGGGFYDRTFANLKKLNFNFYSVGFAFDDQKQEKLPKEIFDYKLDFVLTEKELYKFL